MIISYSGLRSLSWPFVIIFTLAWNALMFLSIWMNGGMGPYKNGPALIVTGITCILASAVSFAIVFSESWRRLVTAEKRVHFYKPSVFVFIGILTALIGIQAIIWSVFKIGVA